MIREARDFRGGIHDRQLPQAHRPLVLGPGAADRARLPDRDDAAGRRLLPQRRLSVRGRHRASARPVRHRAGASRGRGRRVRPGLRPPRRHRRRGARLDAQPRHLVLPGGLDRAAGAAVRAGPTERRPDPRDGPQLAPAGQPARRPGRRGRGVPHGRRARRRAVRALRPRAGRGVLRRDPGAHDRDVPARAAEQDPRRHLRLGGLRRARRRRSAATAHPAHDADQDGGRSAGHRLRGHQPAGQRPDQPRRQLRRRRAS